MWSDKRIALLKKLWLDGYTASQIAEYLGDVTRSAVAGKLYRLRLSGKTTSSRVKSRLSRTVAYQGAMGSSHHLDVCDQEIGEFVTAVAGCKTLETLEEGDCRWPIGDPLKSGFHFCGKERVARRPYCEVHVQCAFIPVPPRKSKGKAVA